MQLPFRKVVVLADGRLRFDHRMGAREEVDDGWWESVQGDWRTRDPSEKRLSANARGSEYRLDRRPGQTLKMTCTCGWAGEYDKAELIRTWSGDMNALWVAKFIATCPNKFIKRDGSCKARLA